MYYPIYPSQNQTLFSENKLRINGICITQTAPIAPKTSLNVAKRVTQVYNKLDNNAKGIKMHQNTPLETDLRLKAAAGLEQEVAKDMESPDKCLGKLLADTDVEETEEDTDNEDQEDTDSSI